MISAGLGDKVYVNFNVFWGWAIPVADTVYPD